MPNYKLQTLTRILTLLLLAALTTPAADVLWLSDIHFDPLASPALVDKLAAAEPAQWQQILSTVPNKFPPYGRDTNWPLFSSVLTNTPKSAAFTIVTGDLLVHHFREQFNAAATNHDDAAFRSFVRKSVEFVALQLKQRAPGKPVFLSLGNNDDECGDYAIQPDGPFLQDTAKTIADLAGFTNTDSFTHLGTYSVLNPAIKHQRIIVLNTVFLSPRYSDRCGQSAVDIGDQLFTWLAKELESAKAHHEKVWLVYHIPPGVDAYATTHAKVPGTVTLLWKEAYIAKLVSLMNQYPVVVTANLAGHIHVDDFRLLGNNNVVMIAPAVSPITGQNSTFRVLKVDSHSTPKDQTTYYLKDLAEPFQKEYTFSQQWRLKSLNYAALFSRLGTDTATTTQWLTLYSTSHIPSSLTLDSFRALWCAEANLSASSYIACTHAQTTN